MVIFRGEEAIGGSVIDKNGAWSTPAQSDVPNGAVALRVDFYTSLTATTPSSSVNHYITVNAPLPIAPVTLTGPAAGSTVETAKPVFTGSGEAGASIVVTDGNGVQLAATTVGEDGTWSVESQLGLANGPIAATATQTVSGATETTKASTLFTVHAVAPVTPVTLTGPAAGSTVDTATPLFTGSGEAGAAIVVSAANGAQLAATTVGEDGTWSVASQIELPNGTVAATATQTVSGATETTKASTLFTVAVVAAPVAAELVVTSPAIEAQVTTDKPVYAGTGEPGASIQVKGSSGRVLGSTTVDADGNWSVTSEIPLGNGHYIGSVVQEIPGGATTQAALSYVVKAVIAKPFSITSPAVGGVLDTETPVYTGVGTPGATVEIRGNSGRLVASATIDAAGNWSATAQFPLGVGRYVSHAAHTHNGVSTAATLEYTIVGTHSVTSPGVGGSTAGPRPVYSGTGHNGSTIQIVGSSGAVVATATVDANGRWTATADFDLGAGHYVGTAVQTFEGVKVSAVPMEYFVK